MNMHMNNNIDWAKLLKEEFSKDYFVQLQHKLKQEYESEVIYPKKEDVFSAFELTSFANTKIVILGQDPYHGPGQAHGLSFSVQPGTPLPPSLKNIFKELHNDLNVPIPNHGHLVRWAKQGVLLMNTVLTVQQGKPNSHRGIGWELFTDRVIERLNERVQPVIFMLWGKDAQKKCKLIDQTKHFILASPHPSPLSAHRGFFGSRPFSKANELLREIGAKPIDWNIGLIDVNR